jgi:hypothetical protein
MRLDAIHVAAAAVVVSIARLAGASPDGPYARIDTEVGVQQGSLVERAGTFHGYSPASTVRQTSNRGGLAYGLSASGGAALLPGFVLAVRAHARIVDLRWGSSTLEGAAVNGFVDFDLALAIDAFPWERLPLRLEGGIGPRWTAIQGLDALVACRDCIFAFDATRGMTAFAAIALEATCRRSPCPGIGLEFDVAHGAGGHSDAHEPSNGGTQLDTFGATVVGTLAFE